MAARASNQVFKRIVQSPIALQRCGCSIVAGPSVFSQALSRPRNLHTSTQAWQASADPQRSTTDQRNTASSHSLGSKAETTIASTAAPAGLARPVQARQVSSASATSSERSEVPVSESSAKAATEAPSPKPPSFSFARPKQHPQTHGNLVCTIKLSSYSDDLENLTFFTQFCVHAAFAFGLPCSLPAYLPTKSSLRTVPRSPFVHKPSQENFVKKEHKRQLKVYDADLGAVGQWIDYISENSMSGVRIKATTWENKPVGFGKQMISDTQDLETTEAQKVKEMADRLLAAGFGEDADKHANDSEVDSATEAAPATKEHAGAPA